jgi:cysteine synthase
MKIPNAWMLNTAPPSATFVRVNDRVWAKLELNNPTGSIKDRPVRYIVENALRTGSLRRGISVVEATSGNTGISLAAISSSLGLRCTIIMPINASEERRSMMRNFGADIVDVNAHDFAGAIALRNEMVESKRFWSPMQFENPLNVECHRVTTGPSIIHWSKSALQIDSFVSGAGTGGTMMGFWQAKNELAPGIKCVLVKPAELVHGIQGIGDGGNYLLDESRMDRIELVSTEEAYARARRFAREQGILVGPSSGANLVVAERVATSVTPGSCVMTLLCDRGERYLSEA